VGQSQGKKSVRRRNRCAGRIGLLPGPLKKKRAGEGGKAPRRTGKMQRGHSGADWELTSDKLLVPAGSFQGNRKKRKRKGRAENHRGAREKSRI